MCYTSCSTPLLFFLIEFCEIPFTLHQQQLITYISTTYTGEETFCLFTHSSPPFTLRIMGSRRWRVGEERVKSWALSSPLEMPINTGDSRGKVKSEGQNVNWINKLLGMWTICHCQDTNHPWQPTVTYAASVLSQYCKPLSKPRPKAVTS